MQGKVYSLRQRVGGRLAGTYRRPVENGDGESSRSCWHVMSSKNIRCALAHLPPVSLRFSIGDSLVLVTSATLRTSPRDPGDRRGTPLRKS